MHRTRERKEPALPVFRLRTTTGQTQTISAGRVLVADGEVRFQPPGQHRPDDGGER